MAVAQKKVKPTRESIAEIAAARWCRDSFAGGNAAAYRRDEDADNYLLAMGDNGNGVWVGPDAGAVLTAQTDKGKPASSRYSVTLMMAAQTVNFVAQDRLPSPERVIDLIDTHRSVTTIPTWGRNKSISVNTSGL